MKELYLIENIQELLDNLQKVESYLHCEEGEESYKQMVKFIKDGRNYVVYEVADKVHFAPSRFIGYKNCNISDHLEFKGKHGTHTSNRLRKRTFLGRDIYDNNLDKKLADYCKSFGVEVSRHEHTFWILSNRIEENTLLNEGFPEGAIKEYQHKKRERNKKLIQKAKHIYLAKGDCRCQICEFDFSKRYGELGKNYIEAHHTIPVSELTENSETKVEDLAFVCSNCHRMLHRKRPWLSMRDLKQILK